MEMIVKCTTSENKYKNALSVDTPHHSNPLSLSLFHSLILLYLCISLSLVVCSFQRSSLFLFQSTRLHHPLQSTRPTIPFNQQILPSCPQTSYSLLEQTEVRFLDRKKKSRTSVTWCEWPQTYLYLCDNSILSTSPTLR